MKIRIISAVVALAILIPLLWIGGIPFAIGLSIISVLAYKEILDLKVSHEKIPTVIKLLGLFCILFIVLGDYKWNSIGFGVNFAKIVLPFSLLLLPTVLLKNEKYSTKDAMYLIGATYLIGFLFNSIIIIRNIDLYLLLYLVAIPIFTDTFAYFVGCLIGKHKMAPTISPKKSWEGAIGGLVGGSISSIILYITLVDDLSFGLVFVTIILSMVGQLGDLVYSKIKRENDIKDFSNIMPGHGGILDRIDSLSFVIFAYISLIYFI